MNDYGTLELQRVQEWLKNAPEEYQKELMTHAEKCFDMLGKSKEVKTNTEILNDCLKESFIDKFISIISR